MELDLSVDPGWVIGLFLAQLRVAVFIVTSPMLALSSGRSARWAFAVAVGTALATPVDVPSIGALVAHAVVNVAVGGLLGWATGLLFHTFAIAGGLSDLSAATSIAAVVDPTRGEQGAVFNRLFAMAGLTLFAIAGGLTLLVTVLGWSVAAIPLDGRIDPSPGIVDVVLGDIGTLMVLGLELAAPVLAALFLIELVLGLAARFAPTANVFLLGMPVKVGLAMLLATASFAMFPSFTDGIIVAARDSAVSVLNGLGVPAG